MRHVVDASGPEIEMFPVDPVDIPTSSRKVSYNSNQDQVVFGAEEKEAKVKVDTFEDRANSFVHKSKAEFSPQELTRTTIEFVPEVLKELSHNVPGLGAVIGGAFLKKDIAQWRELQKVIWHVKDALKSNLPSSMEETLNYVLSQLQRRSDKAEYMMFGKLLQVTGSALTLAGLVTHGATVIPGVVVGVGGSVVKARITLRSVHNYFKKKWAGELSVERRRQARYLYGLTVLHLEHAGYYDGNTEGFKEADQAIKIARQVDGDQKLMSTIAADFVSTIPSLAFLKKQPPSTTEINHFLEYGFWSVMKGIKS